MFGWFITTLIFAIPAVLFLLGGQAAAAKGRRDRKVGVTYGRDDIRPQSVANGAHIVGGAIAALAALFLLIASVTVVPTRNVGVVTSFGRPTGEAMTNGAHLNAPWKKVEKLDASVQTLKLYKGSHDNGCATVRLANQTTACVDATVQWNIDAGGDVIELYRKYRNFGNIENNVVERQLQRALNVVFEGYDPLKAITSGSDKASVTLDDLARQATAQLKTAVGTGINIDNITIPLVHYDETTQGKLNAYAQALADTRIADQREQTAQKIADANALLAHNAAANDPGVQYQNCLNLMSDLAAKDQLKNLSAAWTCDNSGNKTPVIVGGAK